MSRYSLYQQPSDDRYLLVYNGDPKLVTVYTYSLDELDKAITDVKTLLVHEDTIIHRLNFDNISDISELPDTHPELYL